jgi:hypothetical protein
LGANKQRSRDSDDPLINATTCSKSKRRPGGGRDIDSNYGEIAILQFKDIWAAAE